MMNKDTRIGIIGGSGLYEIEALKNITPVTLKTPFGDPSDQFIIGTLDGVQVVFLSRHGRGHRLTPSEINFRANIYGMKKLGVAHIISVTAVGSLRAQIHPLDVVVPDQFFDQTKGRAGSFFENGLVAHVAFSEPICPELAELIFENATRAGASAHRGGTLLCIEGPAFSTQAESNVYRQWGMDIIGMTSLQEAKLAREAEICYAALALVTDYDCWHEGESAVTVGTILQNLEKNISFAKQVIRRVVPKISKKRNCICAEALKNAIMTDPDVIPRETIKKLDLLVGKYLKG